jgi:hypothetical protein
MARRTRLCPTSQSSAMLPSPSGATLGKARSDGRRRMNARAVSADTRSIGKGSRSDQEIGFLIRCLRSARSSARRRSTAGSYWDAVIYTSPPSRRCTGQDDRSRSKPSSVLRVGVMIVSATPLLACWVSSRRRSRAQSTHEQGRTKAASRLVQCH